MNVVTLILKLQDLVSEDPSVATFEVATEGCDCNGDVGSIEVFHQHSQVYLNRAKFADYDLEFRAPIAEPDPLAHINPESRPYLP